MGYNDYKANHGNSAGGYGGRPSAPAPARGGYQNNAPRPQGEAKEQKYVKLASGWEQERKSGGTYGKCRVTPGEALDEALRLIAAGHSILMFPVGNKKNERSPDFDLMVDREPPRTPPGGNRNYNS